MRSRALLMQIEGRSMRSRALLMQIEGRSMRSRALLMQIEGRSMRSRALLMQIEQPDGGEPMSHDERRSPRHDAVQRLLVGASESGPANTATAAAAPPGTFRSRSVVGGPPARRGARADAAGLAGGSAHVCARNVCARVRTDDARARPLCGNLNLFHCVFCERGRARAPGRGARWRRRGRRWPRRARGSWGPSAARARWRCAASGPRSP